MNDLYILGIESSCDDTSIAVLYRRKVLANVTANQEIHAQYGGVVPEWASRAHQQNMVPTLQAALQQSGVSLEQLSAVSFTASPGLLGSLLVGASFAKSLAMARNLPLLAVNHLEAHILAHFIEGPQAAPDLPFLCLTVSGGHTQIVLVEDIGQYRLLGETIDDAAGEAFDKAAKIMGLPYPGGPLIDQYAREGDPFRFSFSKPSIPDLNYSFSGLKTSFLYFLQKQVKENPDFIAQHLADLCASLQRTIVEILLEKVREAVRQTGVKRVALAGGVSANSALRQMLLQTAAEQDWRVHIPPPAYCTDNGAMIAITGYYQYLRGDFATLEHPVKAREPLVS